MITKLKSTFPIHQQGIEGQYSSWNTINSISWNKVNTLSWVDICGKVTLLIKKISSIVEPQVTITSELNKVKRLKSEVR